MGGGGGGGILWIKLLSFFNLKLGIHLAIQFHVQLQGLKELCLNRNVTDKNVTDVKDLKKEDFYCFRLK